MKKLIFVLSFVLVSVSTMSAQNRKGGNNQQRKNNRTERLEKRAQFLTTKMAEEYGLSDDQKVKLLVLNKENFKNSVQQHHPRRGQMHAKAGNRNGKKGTRRYHNMKQDCPMVKGENKGATCDFMVTPMIMKQHRIDMLQKQVKTYEDGLKEIMTKKQFKDYQKRMEDQLKKMQ